MCTQPGILPVPKCQDKNRPVLYSNRVGEKSPELQARHIKAQSSLLHVPQHQVTYYLCIDARLKPRTIFYLDRNTTLSVRQTCAQHQDSSYNSDQKLSTHSVEQGMLIYGKSDHEFLPAKFSCSQCKAEYVNLW